MPHIDSHTDSFHDASEPARREGAPAHFGDATGPKRAPVHISAIAALRSGGAPAHVRAVAALRSGGAPAHIGDAVGPQGAQAHIDALIAELAALQHGVVTLEQLLALGLSARGVQHRVRRGTLHRLYRGVFAVGHRAVSPSGRQLAAVLASGAGAVLSHASAAAAWGIRPSAAPRHDVTVAVHRRGPAGVRLHCVRRLTAADVGEIDGIPVTSVPRTLIDLAAMLDETRLERAVHEAETLRVSVTLNAEQPSPWTTDGGGGPVVVNSKGRSGSHPRATPAERSGASCSRPFGGPSASGGRLRKSR